MMIGPTLVANEDKPLAATIMIFCLTAGLLGGACVSFASTAVSQGQGLRRALRMSRFRPIELLACCQPSTIKSLK